MSMRLFYQHLDDGIFDYSLVNDEGILETKVNNLGTFHRYGLQCTGTLKLGKQIDINAYARYYIFKSELNEFSELQQIANTRESGLESNVSLLADLKHGMSISAALQVFGPEYGVQRKSFKDPFDPPAMTPAVITSPGIEVRSARITMLIASKCQTVHTTSATAKVTSSFSPVVFFHTRSSKNPFSNTIDKARSRRNDNTITAINASKTLPQSR